MTTRAALVLILVLSTGLRLGLALVNRYANDDHVEVATRIQATGQLPVKSDCWECFQPKLFHATLALALRSGGVVDRERALLVAQLLNFLAGSATLWLAWRLIREFPASEPLRLTALGLLAFNPKWIATTSQATNDAFVMLFSSLALALAVRALEGRRERLLWLALLATALAVATKANAWVVWVAISIGLLGLPAWRERPRWRATLAFVVLIPAVSYWNPLTQFATNRRIYGQALVNNIDIGRPLPAFDEPRVHSRPGLLSLRDGLLTFKLASLLEQPRLENGEWTYPPHRTSVWTQLYARAHSLHFDNWPPGWQRAGEGLEGVTRAIFVLALLPTALVLLGLARTVVEARAGLAPALILPLSLLGSLAFVALYAVLYRDFAVMKDIFLYPSILAVPLAFLSGSRALLASSGAVVAAGVALMALYVVEVLALLRHLVSG